MSRLSLRARLASGFLLVAILPLIGLAWFYLHTFEQALTTTVLRNIASIILNLFVISVFNNSE